MWPMCRYAAALVALCVVLLARAESEAVTHVCIHDRIAALQEKSMRKAGKPAVAEVRSVPMGEHSVAPLGRLYDVFFARSTASAGSWAPIRIHISSLDLDDKTRYCTSVGQVVKDYDGTSVTCKKEDILTPEKRAILLDQLLPKAVALHSERLSVESINGRLLIEKLFGNICGWFKVPAEHTTTGVKGADFVLYVRASPTTGTVTSWATTCSSKQDGRPLSGVTNISPRYISDTRLHVRIVAHELLHALGFNYRLFAYKGMTSEADMRGKVKAPLITSANVLQATKEQYGCNRAVGMEMEDRGGDGTALNHWKRRNAKDDLMAGITGIGYYTAITIAAMEDTGFYKGNYAKAESMSWGQNVGCDLLEKPCLVDGVPQIPSMFCNTRILQCTSDRLEVGYCVSSPDATMDDCPYIDVYPHTRCSVATMNILRASVFSPAARCFDGKQLRLRGQVAVWPPSLCADVRCDKSTYEVRVFGNDSFVPCPLGKSVSLPQLSSKFESGVMECPSFKEVCTAHTGRDSATRHGYGYVAAAVLACLVAHVVGI